MTGPRGPGVPGVSAGGSWHGAPGRYGNRPEADDCGSARIEAITGGGDRDEGGSVSSGAASRLGGGSTDQGRECRRYHASGYTTAFVNGGFNAVKRTLCPLAAGRGYERCSGTGSSA